MEKNPHTPTKRNLDGETDSDYVVTPKKCFKKNDITKAKNKRLQKYKTQWEIEHGDWLINDPQSEYNAKCKLCGITFTISSAGIGQVRNFFFSLYVHVCVVCLGMGCMKYPN